MLLGGLLALLAMLLSNAQKLPRAPLPVVKRVMSRITRMISRITTKSCKIHDTVPCIKRG